MKKVFLFLLMICLLISAAGCARLENLGNVELPPLPQIESEPTPPPTIVPTPAPTPEIDLSDITEPETFDPKIANHIIVSISSKSEEYFDPQNGTERILYFSWDTPYVYIEGEPEASQAINEYIARLDETYYTGNDYGVGMAPGINVLLELATDQYTHSVNTDGEFAFAELSSTRTAKVMRADEGMISLMLYTREYTGGEDGVYTNRAYNFDPATGELVSLEKLTSGEENLADFLSECMLKLYMEDKDSLYSQFIADEAEAETAFASLLRDGSWFFDKEGLVIFSDPYELNAELSSNAQFTIPYDELSGHIDSKWMPKKCEGEGSFTLAYQKDVPDGSAEIIDRVVIDEEGTQLCLIAEGIVYDIRLSTVTYSDSFFETAQYWACSYMNDCLLQLSTLIPEGMPNLMLSYSDGAGEDHRLLLTQSGEDGSLILASDDIEAVG